MLFYIKKKIKIISHSLQYTETTHSDYHSLQLALTNMQDVATYINEIKRRRDLSKRFESFSLKKISSLLN
jgi:hypothetical protein